MHTGYRLEMQCISIHAPRKGERHVVVAQDGNENIFQSTLPARGSDSGKNTVIVAKKQFQSTLPARGSDHCLSI